MHRDTVGLRGQMGRSHRVVLANENRLLRSMLKHVIDRASDLEVVDDGPDLATLPSVVDRTHADWTIVPLSPDGTMPEVAHRIHRKCPSVAILGVTTDGVVAKLKRGSAPEEVLNGLSLEGLIALLREHDRFQERT